MVKQMSAQYMLRVVSLYLSIKDHRPPISAMCIISYSIVRGKVRLSFGTVIASRNLSISTPTRIDFLLSVISVHTCTGQPSMFIQRP